MSDNLQYLSDKCVQHVSKQMPKYVKAIDAFYWLGKNEYFDRLLPYWSSMIYNTNLSTDILFKIINSDYVRDQMNSMDIYEKRDHWAQIFQHGSVNLMKANAEFNQNLELSRAFDKNMSL